MKPSLYLETTIPSYLTSRPSRDLIIAGTSRSREIGGRSGGPRSSSTSRSLSLTRPGLGDPFAARERLRVLEPLPLLDITTEVGDLATAILESGQIPRKAATDAAHIAIAAVHGMDFLVTWNCVHIANAAIARRLSAICREHGCECPVICTPEELSGE